MPKLRRIARLWIIISANEYTVTTAYISHAACLRHETGEHHPESPQRLYAVEDALFSSGLMDLLARYDAPQASRQQLGRVHSSTYLEDIERRVPQAGLVSLDDDTVMGPHSLEAASRAAGAVVLGVDLVLQGETDTAFCGIRPPGHHAERNRAMGFCIYNNVAVGAAHALDAGLARVAIVDFDVHHGNGTESIFQNDERVMLCSTFQHPFYPYSPLKPRHERIIHAPLEAGAHSEAFQHSIREYLLPALHSFKPADQSMARVESKRGFVF